MPHKLDILFQVNFSTLEIIWRFSEVKQKIKLT
jgi:hypothetical protein